jgi:hypothetical protein
MDTRDGDLVTLILNLTAVSPTIRSTTDQTRSTDDHR